MPSHRPELPLSPGGVPARHSGDHHPRGLPCWLRPRALCRPPDAGVRLSSPGRPLGDADQCAEPRGRHPRFGADYLEVLEGPSRPAALNFGTRASRCASPKAVVSSVTSACTCCSRVDGPARSASNAVRPASRNSAFHRLIDCSQTFALRAASAVETSRARTLSTILAFCSAAITGGRPTVLHGHTDHALITGLPRSLERDTPRARPRRCSRRPFAPSVGPLLVRRPFEVGQDVLGSLATIATVACSGT